MHTEISKTLVTRQGVHSAFPVFGVNNGLLLFRL